jgi:hypothetical protein
MTTTTRRSNSVEVIAADRARPVLSGQHGDGDESQQQRRAAGRGDDGEQAGTPARGMI